jgi:hypothetical protein
MGGGAFYMIIGPDPVRRGQIRMTTTGDLPQPSSFYTGIAIAGQSDS